MEYLAGPKSGDIQNLDLTGSMIKNVDFQNQDIENSIMFSSALLNADFTNSNISNSDLSFSLITPIFQDTKIENVDFSSSRFLNADFSPSEIKNIKFDIKMCYTCNFEGVNISEMKIQEGNHYYVSMVDSNFRNIDFRTG